ncbi:hypothetical protein NC651_023389 [Populus alba x Populus x berolinensis]|nr:hypothetical protein NC651_023389 [Populus alba x Populus x berolinensis]
MDLREPTQLGSRRQPRASCSGNTFTDSSMLWDPCNKNRNRESNNQGRQTRTNEWSPTT